MTQYFFLCSSLPMLTWAEEPQICSEEFMQQCETQLSTSDYALLEKLSLVPSDIKFPEASLANKFMQWETCLRNALVPSRAKNREFSNYLREEEDAFSQIATIVTSIANCDLLEAEKQLDFARFKTVELLLAAESFTINALMAYKLQLLVLEKYKSRTVERGEQNLEQILNNLQASSNSKNSEKLS